MEIAVEEDLLIHFGHRPGNFTTRGTVLATVWPGWSTERSDGYDPDLKPLQSWPRRGAPARGGFRQQQTRLKEMIMTDHPER
jgi:hypothetical protein